MRSVIAAPIMLLVYLRFRSRESWWLCVLLSLAVLALLYGVFQIALGVELFEGLATPQIKDVTPNKNMLTIKVRFLPNRSANVPVAIRTVVQAIV